MKCWASAIGGCSNKASREHYISKGLWEDQLVVVSGVPWANEKTVSVNSLTAKILCTTHNQLLSALDEEAVRFFRTLTQIEEVLIIRWTKRMRHIDNPIKDTVNGALFERWAAKTLIGVSCVCNTECVWRETRTTACAPPIEAVEGIYGLAEFRKPMGDVFRPRFA